MRAGQNHSASLWTGASAAYYALLVLAHRQWLAAVPSPPGLKWYSTLAYFGLGVLLLGAVARRARTGQPVLWRPVMLLLGSGLALVELALVHVLVGTAPTAQAWLAALLGLALAAILARVAPPGLARHWLGVDQRRDGQDSDLRNGGTRADEVAGKGL